MLVARHESELSGDHRRGRAPGVRRPVHAPGVIDGVERQGWFVDDFTLAELKRLTARERYPDLRPASAAYDGACGIPTFNEVLAMVHAESDAAGRTVGVMAELKHAAHHDTLGLPLDRALLADLRRHGLDHPRSRVTVMSFETTVLRRLAGQTGVPLVQLLDDADGARPTSPRPATPRRTPTCARPRGWPGSTSTPTGSGRGWRWCCRATPTATSPRRRRWSATRTGCG